MHLFKHSSIEKALSFYFLIWYVILSFEERGVFMSKGQVFPPLHRWSFQKLTLLAANKTQFPFSNIHDIFKTLFGASFPPNF